MYVLENSIEKKCNQHFKMVLPVYEHGNIIKYSQGIIFRSI